MDYLDPKKKRNHRIRLYIGYALLTIAIAMATVILLYVGRGFYVDTNTGDLIQNGQLVINSDPDGSSILLNGRLQRAKTAGNLVVPSGNYTVQIRRNGYRDWSADVILDGGRIQTLDYARLIPMTMTPVDVQTFATPPTTVTESVDRHYLSLQFAEKPLSIFVVDLTHPDITPLEIALPKTVLSDPEKVGALSVTEWSSDAKHMLVQNLVAGVKQDFLLVNRETPDQVTNLTTLLAAGTVTFTMRDRQYNQYYVYDAAAKTVSTANLENKVIISKLTDVIAYKTYGNDSVLYVTSRNADKGKVQVRLSSGDKTYLMREVTESPTYLLDISKLNDAVVLAIGAPAENKVTILRNPLSYLRANPEQTIPLATTVLQVMAPSEVSFSTDTTAVFARGKQNFAAHNFEEDKTTIYTLPDTISAHPLQWADGKHLTTISGGNVFILDYDGANLQQLVPGIDAFGTYFDSSYDSMYSFTLGTNGKLFNVTRTSLKVK